MTTKQEQSDHDLLIAIHAQCVGRCQDVERHRKTLYGNGKVGLVTKVHLLMWTLGIGTGVGTIVLGELLLRHFTGG